MKLTQVKNRYCEAVNNPCLLRYQMFGLVICSSDSAMSRSEPIQASMQSATVFTMTNFFWVKHYIKTLYNCTLKYMYMMKGRGQWIKDYLLVIIHIILSIHIDQHTGCP